MNEMLFCTDLGNISMTTYQEEQINLTTSEQRLLKSVNLIFYNYGLPVVCLFGIIGNILNLAILTRRKLRKSFRTVEQSANVCLIALALSDLMFCLFAFPTTFLPINHFTSYDFILFYGKYSTAVINTFILSSTWLTVTMATERYLVICHPFNNRLFMTQFRTKVTILFVYILSVVFNIPVFWRYNIHRVGCGNQTVGEIYELVQVPFGNSQWLDDAYRVFWAIVGNFIPLILLMGFNICICYKIHKSYKLRQKFHCRPDARDPGGTLTITLIVIVVMFLILVAPSEMVLHVGRMVFKEKDPTYKSVEVIMNFLQSVNFSVNFVLYCLISNSFRKTLRHLVCCQWYHRRSFTYKFSMSHYPNQSLKSSPY